MYFKHFLHIRHRQLEGLMRDVPILYRIALLCALLLGVKGINAWCNTWEHTLMTEAGIASMALTIHGIRTDKQWLAMHSPAPWKVYGAEYILFSSILWLPLLISSYFYLLPCLWLALLAIGALPYREVSQNRAAGQWLPLPIALFEWKAGFRKMGYVPFWLYLLAWPACYWPYAPLVLLWLVQASMVNCYNWHEPREILENGGKSAKHFIHRKLGLHLQYWLIGIAPILIISAIAHQETLWLAVFFLCFSSLIQAFLIVAKYALYEPNTRLEGNQLIIGLGLYSIAIPFLLPIPLLMGIRYYRMALRNLNFYWDA